MAQRSARARSKLDKITAANGTAAPHPSQRRPALGHGAARLGSGGLLTPSASSVSGSSTRNSQPPPRIGKGALRSFFDAQGEKLRGRLAHGTQRRDTDGATSFYAGLGGGVGLGHGNRGGHGGLSGLGTIGEERVQVRRWEGTGSRGENWDGGGQGKKDLDLWFPDGDTLVYLTDKPLPPRNPLDLYKPPVPQPSFRLRSSVLRRTDSMYLVSLLEASTRDRPMTPAEIAEEFPAHQTEEQLMDYEYQLRRTRTLELTSSAASADTQSTARTQDTFENGITYRLYFPAPARCDKTMRHRFHLATRNFFAMLFGQPLVGITVGQALTDLMERTDKYLFAGPSPMEYDLADRGISEIESPFGSFSTAGSTPAQERKTSSPSSVAMVLDYIDARELSDVRNWAEGAAGLLVWSERAGSDAALRLSLTPHDLHRVESLWREGFVHCTGLLSSLQMLPEWREISPITKALIDRASLEIQVRVSNADARMAGFNFHDMWPVSSAGPPPARLSFDRFQKFLVKHYASRFGSWPPPEGRFTRTLYLHLQRDFTTLYSYLVDQDAVWSPPHDQPTPSSRRAILKPGNPTWRADDEFLPMADILSTFDDRENHPPIPHPFPLVPPTNRAGAAMISPSGSGGSKKQKGFSFAAANPRNRGAAGNPGAAQAALALSESTNIEALRSSTTSNPLLEAFQVHEKSTPAHEISPHDARKGRWIMIYGVLQSLASVAVDAPGISWAEGVEYWINPKLRDTPPWGKATPQSPASEKGDERSHFRSHCWVSVGPREVAAVPLLPSGFIAPAIAARRMRQRSRSRSRKALRALHKEQAITPGSSVHTVSSAVALPTNEEVLVASPNRNESSGDEGDDEMDAESPSPPPSAQTTFRTWGQRHVRGDAESPGVIRAGTAPWEAKSEV